jgi:predicted component of type VI protein secretion system
VEPAEDSIWHAGLILQNRGKLDRIISWDRDQLVAGRSRECDIYLEEAEVSRRHAMFVREDGGYEVRDLDSINGLLVNGEKTQSCRLEVGDVVKIEDFEFTFLLDRHPIGSEVKTDAPPGPIAGEAEGSFNMTMIDEELPIGPAITNPSATVEPPGGGEEVELRELSSVDLSEMDAVEEAPELPSVDLSEMDAVEEAPELPSVDLSEMDAIEEAPEPPSVDLSEMDAIEETPEPPSVDLSEMDAVEETPEPPAVGLYGRDAAESEELIEVEEVSSPSQELEGPSVPVVTDEAISVELRVRLADLPEPVRAALAELEEAELKLPVEIVLKADD